MKKSIAALLIAGQFLIAAQPAFAADFAGTGEQQRTGAFAGFRLRMPLDGPQQRQVRAGFALAPTLSTRESDGEVRTRFGEGVEYGFRGNRAATLSIAGQDLRGRRFGAAQDDDHNDTLPRIGLAVLGVGLLLGLAYWGFTEAVDCDRGDDCS